ncbi:DNA recombination protein RmuC [Hydrocarboniphaga sp.]|uniref:DNA recombination protein RmuC n=1 Tax=Hydrocarboniphaga sp. TaxID=2033016 RepID=UPI002ABC2C32|nr:DNA recombination protein RmuC [Hydrocarboniphaga sp.]MDZ4078984.1 DNA recombination protein RmuC [Hydrocarboniphaga sp.]
MTLSLALAAVFALVAGVALGWLIGRLKVAALADRAALVDAARAEAAALRRQLSESAAATAGREATLAEQLRQLQSRAQEFEQRARVLDEQRVAATERAMQAESQVRIVEGARDAARVQHAELQSRHDVLLQQHEALASTERKLQGELSALRTSTDALREQLQQQKVWFEEQTRHLRTEAENLTGKILEEKTQRFTALNAERLGELLNPLREQLGDFKQKVEQVYTDEAKERSALKAQVEQLHSLNKALSDRTEDLTQALTSNSKVQGDWGEMVLKRLFEESGLARGREYEIQDSIESEAGRTQRPDAVIYLPEDRQLVVDSKVSLTAWTDYCAARDEAERAACLKRHLGSVRAHLRELALRDYTRSPDLHTVDFVVMFVPIEAALLEALRGDDKLYAEAFKSKVVLVSPTTLFAVIKMVEGMWSVRRREQNAEKIAEAGGKLYDKLEMFVASFESVRKGLASANKALDDAWDHLSSKRGNALKLAKDMRDMGLRTKGKARIVELVAAQEALPLADDAEPEADEDAPNP